MHAKLSSGICGQDHKMYEGDAFLVEFIGVRFGQACMQLEGAAFVSPRATRGSLAGLSPRS